MDTMRRISSDNPVLTILAAVTIGAIAVYAIRAIAKRRGADEDSRDPVDVAVEDSFPASDPPAWTTGRK